VNITGKTTQLLQTDAENVHTCSKETPERGRETHHHEQQQHNNTDKVNTPGQKKTLALLVVQVILLVAVFWQRSRVVQIWCLGTDHRRPVETCPTRWLHT